MPTYDYVCDACSHKFEQTRMISERDQPISEPCPKCQKEGVPERMRKNLDSGTNRSGQRWKG